MNSFLKTPEAARSLAYHRLIGLLRFREIAPPLRDSSCDCLWTASDLERARQALRPRQSPAEASL
jgi:hypothetical protein